MADKESLTKANKAKKDEFYTQLADIETELRHYRDQFEGKVVFCNCDDPYESNFFKYFAMNFARLGLKKLIATSYAGSPITGTQLSLLDSVGSSKGMAGRPAYRAEITDVPDFNDDGSVGLVDVEHLLQHGKNIVTPLKQGGDFRSPECVALLDEADIVVTNPPFSLFREFLALLVDHENQFLIIGNTNALTYQEVFGLIKEDRLRTGYTNFNVGMYFNVPDSWSKFHRVDEDGRKQVRVSTSCWFTTLDVDRHRHPITLYKRYDPAEFPRYDNYDAIEVGRYTEIPCDYEGPMGVPITFLDKYCPSQFEILGWTRGKDEFEARPIKRYENARQLSKDGTEKAGGKVNTGPTLLLADRPPDRTVYIADDTNGYLVQPYMRVIVRNRKPDRGKQ